MLINVINDLVMSADAKEKVQYWKKCLLRLPGFCKVQAKQVHNYLVVNRGSACSPWRTMSSK